MAGPGKKALRFDPPGPGSWVQGPVHFPRPITRYWVEMHPEPFARGTADFMAYYGMPLKAMQMAYVNGIAYRTMVPAPAEEIPQRFARAEEVFSKKVWRDQLHEWDEIAKPAAVKIHRELQSVDADALSDEALSAYLARCREHHSQMIFQHMRFTGSAMIAVGDLLAHLQQWAAGVARADALALMRGAAPVSAGASGALERLIAAFENDAKARRMLASDDDPAQVLGALRAFAGDVGAAVDDYLGLVGYRLLDGFDISGRYALELPDQLLRAMRTSVQNGGSESIDIDERIAAIRAQVAAPQRAEFDELLGEARLMYRLRDERGVYSDIWASGIMRRAVLAAGRRLQRKGRLQDAEDLIDAGFEEMRAMLSGGGPPAEELATRLAERSSRTAKDAPPTLGPPEPPPPDPARLPPGAARVMRAMGIAIGELFGSSEVAHEGNVLRGLAASGGVYEGPARRVSGPAEFDRIAKGDVLVTESTSEAFNILLPLLGAIVTDAGGLLSHSAIVAREYGIPGVVGTRDATDRIRDGARVRVDGDAGQVTVYP